jgi:hypothetical protein
MIGAINYLTPDKRLLIERESRHKNDVTLRAPRRCVQKIAWRWQDV